MTTIQNSAFTTQHSSLGSPNQQSTIPNPQSPIGYIVGGGLKENLRVRLTVPAHSVQEGAFVVVESGKWLFYGLVTDLQLGATDPRFPSSQISRSPPRRCRTCRA